VARRVELAGLEPLLVVTVSNHGASARVAASALLAQGFEDVRYLDGGIERWLDLGYPVEP
jgi:rhodanese-related sulfurtransferase